MHFDRRLQLANAQAVTTGGYALSSFADLVDISNRRDIADAEDLTVQFRITTTFTAGVGSPNVRFGVLFADDAVGTNLYVPVTTGGLAVTGYTVLVAVLSAGREFTLPVPRGVAAMLGDASNVAAGLPGAGLPVALKRFIGVVCINDDAGSEFGQGAFSAWLVWNLRKQIHYPALPLGSKV